MILTVRLTPKAAHDRIDEVTMQPDGNWLLKARVRAVPENGKANTALLKLVAESLKLPKSAVTLSGGGRSRDKRVAVAAEEALVDDALGRIAASSNGGNSR